MKKSLLLLALCLSAFVCLAQNTTIVASHIDVFNGIPVTGQFCLTPTDGSGNPINVTTTTGQQFTPQTPLCFPIVAGVLSGAAIVPDTSLTQPANVCYALTIKNNFGQIIGSYQCLQPQGGTWSFDSYVPSTLPSIPALQMPQFKTNGTLNPAQTVLDLRGPGVSYSAGGIINITGAGSGGTSLHPADCAGSGAPSWCSGSTADAYIRAACSALPSTGGIVDLAGLTGNLTATTRGCSTSSKQVVFIQDPTSTLTVTETDGDVTFPLDNNSMFIGLGNGACVSNAGIRLTSSTNIAGVVGPAHVDGSQEQFTAKALCITGHAGATVSIAPIFEQRNFANTTISENQVFVCNGYCAAAIDGSDIQINHNWFNVSAGGTGVSGTGLHIKGSGALGTGCNIQTVYVSENQIEHAYGGGPDILVEGDGAGALACNVRIDKGGVERGATSGSTIGIKLQDCLNCSVDHVNSSGTSGGTDLINISQTALGRTQNVSITDMYVGGSYTNGINDTTPGGKVLSSSAYPQITTYYAQPGYDSDAGGTLASAHQTGKTAAISTTTLCSSASCPAGQYAVNVSMMETGTACSSATAGSAVPSISWTDSNGTAQTSPVPALLGGLKFATSLTGAFASGTLVISTNGSAISYSTAYTACTTGTGTYQLDVAVGTPGSGPAAGNAAVAIAGQTITPAIVNRQISAAGVNGAGIGVAQSAWSSSTNYPQCSAVSRSGNNYLAVASSTNVTPGTNTTYWWQVPNANTPTAADCAFYIAAAQVNGITGGQQLILPPGNTNTCIGFMEPTVTTPGNPVVAILGAGKHVSTITQTCSISNAVLTQPDSGTNFAFAGIDWEGFTVNANWNAPADMNVYGAQQFKIKHVQLLNPADGSDHYIEFGHVAPITSLHQKSWVYEPHIDDLDTGNYHGPGSGASITAAVSGGVPTLTVVSGGSSFNSTYSQLILSGTGANADIPCTSRGTDTINVTSGAITSISTTATGCTSPLYASVFGGNQVKYCIKFNDASDSKDIMAMTPSECNTGVYLSNISSQLDLTKTHPIATYIGIEDLANNNFYATQMDTIYRYGFDFEGATNTENLYGTKFEYSASIPGVADYHFGTVTGSPATAPYQITIFGDACGNAPATTNGYYHFLASNGGGNSFIPLFVHPYETISCDQLASNSTTNNYAGSVFRVAGGNYAGYFVGNGFDFASGGAFTVSGLPSASSAGARAMLLVIDASSYTPGTCTGGGSDYMIAVSNGTNWSCH